MKSLAQIQKNLAKILKAEKGLNFIAVLSKKFPQAKIYLVGGMARDLFLGRESKDYDFVVCGVPAKKLETILKKLGTTNLVGKRFGVFKFAPKNSALTLDIALPRTEHAWGTGGYRDVETQSDWRLPIEKDLARRDFTINAMALELGIRNKELGIMDLTDPFDGLSDLKKKLIRTVGKPEERFKEDFSRMLRGLRFASQLNFQIEKNTWDTLVKMMKKINATLCHSRPRSVIPANAGIQSRAGSRGNPAAGSRIKCGMTTSERIVPYEVISKEFLKSLVINPLKTVDLWDEAGALKQLMPELLKMQGCPQPPEFHKEGDVWTHTYLALGNLTTPGFTPYNPKKNNLQSKNKKIPITSLIEKMQSLGGGYAGFKKFVRSLPPSFQNEPLISPTLVLAVLFHDLGKPYTIKTPEKDGVDRIRTNEHDSVGAKLAKQIGERLRLSSVPDMHCNLDHLAWLIQHHLLTVHGDPMKFTNRTIEKYFFNPLVPGTDLLKLIYCDQMASFVGGKPQLGSLPRLVKRIKMLLGGLRQTKHLPTGKAGHAYRQAGLPPPLLDGREIMMVLKLKPGRLVGDLKDRLREAQLAGKVKNKKQAKDFLIKIHS